MVQFVFLRHGEATHNEAFHQKNENDLLLNKPNEIILSNPISVQELAAKICVSETEIIRTLFLDGIIVNINQILDINTAISIGEKLDVKIIAKEEEIKNIKQDIEINDEIDSDEETEINIERMAIEDNIYIYKGIKLYNCPRCNIFTCKERNVMLNCQIHLLR